VKEARTKAKAEDERAIYASILAEFLRFSRMRIRRMPLDRFAIYWRYRIEEALEDAAHRWSAKSFDRGSPLRP
jgi:hypothetical protein